MYDDIRGDLRIKPIVSWLLLFTCLLATGSIFFDARFESIYGVHHTQGVNILTRLTAPFVHGYSPLTSIMHLATTVILMYFMGTFLEKIIGSFRFLILTLLSLLLYIFMHRMLLMIGHGFTPILMTFSGVLLIVQLEARFVKTNAIFDDYYRLMWTIQVLTWVIIPVVFSIAPMYFDSKAKLFQILLYGNILHIVGFVFGILIALVFRKDIRDRLVHYTRKKYMANTKLDNNAWILALCFPLYLILIFLFRPA
jgi:membrane associated rhomboid family serine protease